MMSRDNWACMLAKGVFTDYEGHWASIWAIENEKGPYGEQLGFPIWLIFENNFFLAKMRFC